MIKISLERKGFIWPTLPGPNLSLSYIKAGIEAETMEDHNLLADLLAHA